MPVRPNRWSTGTGGGSAGAVSEWTDSHGVSLESGRGWSGADRISGVVARASGEGDGGSGEADRRSGETGGVSMTEAGGGRET